MQVWTIWYLVSRSEGLHESRIECPSKTAAQRLLASVDPAEGNFGRAQRQAVFARWNLTIANRPGGYEYLPHSRQRLIGLPLLGIHYMCPLLFNFSLAYNMSA